MFLKSKYQRYLKKGVRYVGILDIETQADNFKADRGHVVSYVLRRIDLTTGKFKDFHACITKTDINKVLRHKHLEKKNCLDFDERILKKMVKDLKTCNMIVGHYSNYFDIPFVRTRCAILKIPFIRREDNIRFMDTWLIAKNTLKLSRNSLENVGEALGIKTKKTKVKWLMWKLSLYGHKRALAYIMDHNVKDVIVDYKVWLKSEQYTAIPSRFF